MSDKPVTSPTHKSPKLSREDVAKRDLGHTQVRRAPGIILIGFFLLTLVSVPIIQLLWERVQDPASAPGIFELKELVSAGSSGFDPEAGTMRNILSMNASTLRAINRFEDDLEDNSFLTYNLLQPVQVFMSGVFGIGNEEVYTGSEGWLYFRADVDHCTGPGFLSSDWLKIRALSGNEYTGPPQPDPRVAILQFRDQLAERGIRLVVLPVPVKPTVHGEHLAHFLENNHAPLTNPSYPRFLNEMREHGVEILDVTKEYKDHKQEQDAPLYLKTDTHWTFDTMKWTAEKVATFAGIAVASDVEKPGFEAIEVTHLGDIGQMLELPPHQTLFPPESQTIHRPLGETPPDSQAAILLLGDSFSNIYSMPELEWGEQAGFAEQLAYASGRPVRKIAINAGGAYAARSELVQRLSRGEDPLKDVDLVIWEFATRELSQGDWRLMTLPASPVLPEQTAETPRPTTALTATVVERTFPPRPGSVPYRDCLVSVHLTDVTGPGATTLPKDVLVYTWGMRDNQLVQQDLKKGDQVTLTLQPWAQARDAVGGLNREELMSDAAFLLDLYWTERLDPTP